MLPKPHITIGLSSHRLEVLPYAQEAMGRHDAIVLEENPEPRFPEVLSDTLTEEDYLEDEELAFPRYNSAQLKLLKELYRAGKAIFQVEPYLERLILIHDLFFQGASRAEVASRAFLQAVYETESEADRTLLSFYARSHTAPFPNVVRAVMEFAQADAARFRLRDLLRAQALVPLAQGFASIYVEAGDMHLYLIKALRGLLSGKARLQPVYLTRPLVQAQCGIPYPYGPGDLLTLRHIFQVPVKKAMAELLAARSLIYIQLLNKDEMAPGADPTPHLTNEIQSQRLVAQLTFQDCAALYPQVRTSSPEVALQAVLNYQVPGGDHPRLPLTTG